MCGAKLSEKVQEEHEQKIDRLELADIEISFYQVGRGMIIHTNPASVLPSGMSMRLKISNQDGIRSEKINSRSDLAAYKLVSRS